MTPRGRPASPQLVQVLRPLHEGQRDPVRAELQREGEVARSFSVIAETGSTAPTTLTPLRSDSGPADHHLGGGVFVASLHLEAHLAVVEQELHAGLQCGEHLRMRHRHPRRAPGRRVEVEIEALRPVRELDRPPANRPTRSFGPCRSTRMPIGRPVSCSIARIMS